MNKKLIAFLAVAFALVLLIVLVAGGKYKEASPVVNENNTETDSRVALYPMEEVIKHSSEDSCWAVVRGGVYDLTSWISQHPGGKQAILGLCGKDGTAQFEKQHGGNGGPEQALASFKIGELGIN